MNHMLQKFVIFELSVIVRLKYCITIKRYLCNLLTIRWLLANPVFDWAEET